MIRLQDCCKVCASLLQYQKASEQLGVKRTALPAYDHLDRFVKAVRIFIASLAYQSIIHIRKRYSLCAGRNFVTHQPVWVAFPIPSLMVVQRNIIRISIKRLIAQRGNAGQQIRSPCLYASS